MPVPPDREPSFGLSRIVVPTGAGTVVFRTGRRSSGADPVATVLLHGAAGTWTTWLPLLAACDRAGAPLRDLVIPDLPGWGASPGPAPSPAALARAVAEVARAAGYRRWTVVGHSLGGIVALELAARHRAETLAVGLVSPSGAGVRDAVLRPLRGGRRLAPFAGMLLAMRLLRGLGRGAPPLLRALRATGVLRLLAAPLFHSPVDRSVTDALADEIRPASFVAVAEAVPRVDTASWRRIRVPVRSIRGLRDVFARADDDAVLAELVPDLVTTVLPDAGHFAHVERPAATLAALALPLGLAPTDAGGGSGTPASAFRIQEHRAIPGQDAAAASIRPGS